MEIKINENIGQYGLFTTKMYLQNETIFTLSGTEYSYPTRESIYVGKINGNDVHVHDMFGQWINHSFNPSTVINGYNVVALRNMNIGDEITFDYNTNEINMASPFVVDGKLVNGKLVN
jgi:hypothetical protein